MKMNVGILDYGIGNVRSISNAILKTGNIPTLTNNEKELKNADALILPGVGAFKVGMENLLKYNLDEFIFDFVKTGKPFLGICLGMQMLLDESEEYGNTLGLGLISGVVKKINVSNQKLPHISWNDLHEPNKGAWEKSPLVNVVNPNVYFVHTYAANPANDESLLAYTLYDDQEICAAVRKENIFGFQFHPEKSGEIGLNILRNFLNN